jgi:DNA-directed RNA polymerase specialized sigma24 family protein
MPSEGSITQCLRDLGNGERRDEAAGDLWQRFFGELTRHALRKLQAMHTARGVADEEDVAERAFTKVCRGIESGQLRPENRVDLRKLLLSATAREAINQFHRQRRDSDPQTDESALRQVPAREMTPELLALAEEASRQLLDSLGEELLRQIALWKLIGHTNDEIARKLRCSRAKVGRKLARICETWAEFVPGGPARPGPRNAPGPSVAVDGDGTTTILRGLAGQP